MPASGGLCPSASGPRRAVDLQLAPSTDKALGSSAPLVSRERRVIMRRLCLCGTRDYHWRPRLSAAQESRVADNGRTIIYFIRHPESDEADASNPTHPLTPKGMERAQVFASTVREVSLMHVFSTHTTRARQTVAPAASEHGLEVTQVPKPGSLLNGAIVSDATPSRLAVEPLIQALRSLPAGSSALVGVNADNIFAVMSGQGTSGIGWLSLLAGKHLCAVRHQCLLSRKGIQPVLDFDHRRH